MRYHSTVMTIAGHEMRNAWRDGRLRAAAFIVLLLLLAAMLSGWSSQQRLAQEHDLARRTEQARWLGQGEKNPHSAAHYGVYAFKPVSALAAIDQGLQPFLGVGVWLEAVDDVVPGADAQDEPALAGGATDGRRKSDHAANADAPLGERSCR